MNTERQAFVAFATKRENGMYALNFGPGDHSCERWLVTEDQLGRIALFAFEHILKPKMVQVMGRLGDREGAASGTE